MSLEIKVDTKGLERIIQQEPQRVDRWLRGVAEQMVGDIKLSFGTGPAGRRYKRDGKYHVASSAGNPPNSDSGNLTGTIKSKSAGRLTYHISAGTGYDRLLEYGTRKMAARPFMGPVFAEWQGKIEKDAKENLNLE